MQPGDATQPLWQSGPNQTATVISLDLDIVVILRPVVPDK
jgi:hypothetical protein